MFKLRRILQISAGIIFAGILVGYSLFQFRDFWLGPTITITQPTYGIRTDDPLIRITGQAKRIAFLYLNGRQIYTNPNGRFNETLLLSPGHNIITVSARDTFGRQTRKQIEIMHTASSTFNPLSFYERFRHQRRRRTNN